MNKYGSLERAAKAAKARRDWASAEAAYQAETRLRYCPFLPEAWVKLGLMRDYQGKREAAFTAYQKGLSIGSHHGPNVGGNDPEIAEAAAHCGLMCEVRSLHADACECFYTARRLYLVSSSLPMKLEPDKTSPAVLRTLLGDVLRGLPKPNGTH